MQIQQNLGKKRTNFNFIVIMEKRFVPKMLEVKKYLISINIAERS